MHALCSRIQTNNLLKYLSPWAMQSYSLSAPEVKLCVSRTTRQISVRHQLCPLPSKAWMTVHASWRDQLTLWRVGPAQDSWRSSPLSWLLLRMNKGDKSPPGKESRRKGTVCAKAWLVVHKAALSCFFIIKTGKLPLIDVSGPRRWLWLIQG